VRLLHGGRVHRSVSDHPYAFHARWTLLLTPHAVTVGGIGFSVLTCCAGCLILASLHELHGGTSVAQRTALANPMKSGFLVLWMLGGCAAPGKDRSGESEVDSAADLAVDSGVDTPEDDSGGEPDGGDTGEAEWVSPWEGSSESDRLVAADAMVEAASAFLASLDDYQRGQVQYAMDHPERSEWSNLPHAIHLREGVSFGELNEERAALGWELIRVSLSAAGLERAQAIVQMEELLWDDGDFNANPGNYFFTFFDSPSGDTPWGWQLDGHHLALNFTVVGAEVTIAPSLWGTTPKTWPSGEHAGLTPMADEEDLAFAWMASLDEAQLNLAQLNPSADPDLMAGPASSPASWPVPEGIPVTSLTPSQRTALLDWVAVYVGNMATSQAEQRMHEISESFDDVSVAWLGGTEPGSMMYYRIQGSRVLIEFDHTRTADHMHAVYRDPANEYGTDWLSKHLVEHHSHELDSVQIR